MALACAQIRADDVHEDLHIQFRSGMSEDARRQYDDAFSKFGYFQCT